MTDNDGQWGWTRAVWLENDETMEGTVPSCWIKEGQLWWPKDYKMAISKRQFPKSNWDTFQLIKSKFSDSDKMLCEKYNFSTTEEMDDSDNQSDNVSNKATLPGRAKRRKTNQAMFSDNEDGVSFDMLPTCLMLPKISDISQSEMDINLKQPSSSKRSIEFNRSLDKENVQVTPKNSLKNLPREKEIDTSNLESDKENQATPKNKLPTQSFPWSDAKFQNRTIFLLTEIRSLLKKSLENNKNNGDGNTVNTVNDFRDNFIQVTTLEQLEELEIKLEDENYKKSLENFLSSCGGKNCEDSMRMMYRKLMANSVLSMLNLKGRGEKKAVMDLQIYKIIENIVITKYGGTTEANVKQVTASLLKAAPDRPGGSGRKGDQ